MQYLPKHVHRVTSPRLGLRRLLTMHSNRMEAVRQPKTELSDDLIPEDEILVEVT